MYTTRRLHAAAQPRKQASGILEIEVAHEVWEATDDLTVFLAHPGRRLLAGMPYAGPVRVSAEAHRGE